MAPAVTEKTIAPDPTAIDPQHYTVEFENEKVRVLRIRYGPNEKSAMHRHPPLVGVFLTPQRSRHVFADGRVMEMEGKAGDVRYMDSCEHAPENMSNAPFELIAVELKS